MIIAKAGTPVAMLVAIEPAKKPRRIGMLDGLFKVPDDFDTMFQAEIEAMFYGE